MVDPIAVKQAIKDGQLKVYWKESRPHIISVYLGDVIRERGSFVEEIGDTIKLCDIRILEPRTEYERGYEKGKEDEHRWWSKLCANCDGAIDEPQPSKILEAYAKGYKDGADAVKPKDEPQTEIEWWDCIDHRDMEHHVYCTPKIDESRYEREDEQSGKE